MKTSFQDTKVWERTVGHAFKEREFTLRKGVSSFSSVSRVNFNLGCILFLEFLELVYNFTNDKRIVDVTKVKLAVGRVLLTKPMRSRHPTKS